MNWGFTRALAVGAVLGTSVWVAIGATMAVPPLRRWLSIRRPPASTPAEPAAGPDPGEPMLPNLAQSSLNALHVGVLVLDADDRPAFANPAAREMGLIRARPVATAGSSTPWPAASGLRSEATREDVASGARGPARADASAESADRHAEAHTIVRTLAGQTRRSGLSRVVELDLPRAGGTGEPLGVHVRSIDIGGGYVAVEAADVTESHRLARVRRDFVANVSHELKTPVGALQLLAEALLDAVATPDHDAGDLEAVARFAERIRHESARLGRLVTELLELSRLQGAEPMPEPERVSVDRIINEVIDRNRMAATTKDIEVRVGGARGLVVYGSEGQLVTAVSNLVENAIAYSAEHTVVEMKAGSDGDGVQIQVCDQGMGIERRDLDRIFERFYRADRARSRATGGTGLGLAIVKHIATNHGGRVEVSSTVGEGSTFTLRLPGRFPEIGVAQSASVEIDAYPAQPGA